MRGRMIILGFLLSGLFLGVGLNFTKVESQILIVNSNRPKRSPEPINLAPGVESVVLSKEVVQIPCPKTNPKQTGECFDEMTVEVTTDAKDPENDVLTYDYEVSGGKIVGFGAKVVWDLTGVQPGAYTIKASVDDGCGDCGKTVTKTIEVSRGCECDPIPEPCPSCPALSIKSNVEEAKAGNEVIFTAEASDTERVSITYLWTVSGGTIIEGQGTSRIKVKVNRRDKALTAKVETTTETRADCPACQINASKTVLLKRR